MRSVRASRGMEPLARMSRSRAVEVVKRALERVGFRVMKRLFWGETRDSESM